MNDEYKTDRGEPTTSPEDWLTNAESSTINDISPEFKQGFAEGYAAGSEDGYLKGLGKARNEERSKWQLLIQEMLVKEDNLYWGLEDTDQIMKGYVGPSSVGNFRVAPATEGLNSETNVAEVAGWTEKDVKRLFEQTTRGKMK